MTVSFLYCIFLYTQTYFPYNVYILNHNRNTQRMSIVTLACLVGWKKVHPQNVGFQNVRFQNVRFQNVWNVRFTKRQVYKTSGLQNVWFTKRQVFKTSGCKKTSMYVLYLWLVEIRRFCCSHVCRQSDGCVLFSILEVFFAIYHHNG